KHAATADFNRTALPTAVGLLRNGTAPPAIAGLRCNRKHFHDNPRGPNADAAAPLGDKHAATADFNHTVLPTAVGLLRNGTAPPAAAGLGRDETASAVTPGIPTPTQRRPFGTSLPPQRTSTTRRYPPQ
ncbi:hypothetical protein Vafri_2020, partial [Volvox africanus]